MKSTYEKLAFYLVTRSQDIIMRKGHSKVLNQDELIEFLKTLSDEQFKIVMQFFHDTRYVFLDDVNY